MQKAYTFRDIIKAKAAALAREAEFGDDFAIKASLHDLVMFANRMRRIGPMSLSYVFDDLEQRYQVAERERAEASLRLRRLAEEGQ